MSKKVLIVDDDHEIRKALSKLSSRKDDIVLGDTSLPTLAKRANAYPLLIDAESTITSLREEIAGLKEVNEETLKAVERVRADNAVLKAGVERLKNKAIHCEKCGGSWYDDGYTASCPSCRIVQLGASLNWERSAKENAYDHIEYTKTLRARVTELERELTNEQTNALRLEEANSTLRSELDAEREEVASAIICAGLATGHGDTVTDMLNEMVEQVVALSKRAESAEGKVEKVRAAIDGGEEDGLAAWVIVRELKAILPPKEDK